MLSTSPKHVFISYFSLLAYWFKTQALGSSLVNLVKSFTFFYLSFLMGRMRTVLRPLQG